MYGDNGSGKSGYARLLKRITRARHQEDILTDVFRDTSLAKPTAVLSVRIGDAEQSLAWPESSRPELQRMLFYDAACGNAYIASESDFPVPALCPLCHGRPHRGLRGGPRTYRRQAWWRMALQPTSLPAVPERGAGDRCGQVSHIPLGKLVGPGARRADREVRRARQRRSMNSRSGSAPARRRHEQGTAASHPAEREARRDAQAPREPRRGAWQPVSGDASTTARALKSLEDAAALLAESFESEPVARRWKRPLEDAVGICQDVSRRSMPTRSRTSQSWKTNAGACYASRLLDVETRNRLARFDEFVRNDTQVRLQEARSVLRPQGQERHETLPVFPGSSCEQPEGPGSDASGRRR